VDETVVKTHGLRAHVWSTVDIDSSEILAVYALWCRDMIIALKFLKIVLDRCLNKPMIIVDRGPWYRWSLEKLGPKYQCQRISVGNRLRDFLDILRGDSNIPS
jgi:transposase-like protein